MRTSTNRDKIQAYICAGLLLTIALAVACLLLAIFHKLSTPQSQLAKFSAQKPVLKSQSSTLKSQTSPLDSRIPNLESQALAFAATKLQPSRRAESEREREEM